MGQYSKELQGYFTSTGVAKFISLPILPSSFEFYNKTKWDTATNNLVRYATSWQEDAAGTAYTTCANGNFTTNQNLKITSGGFSWISAGTYSYGPTLTISGVTAANPAVVTTTAPHNLVTGDAVLLYGTTSMLQISGVVYTVTVLSTTTFSIDVNASGFAAAATAGFCKKLIYVDLYTPEASAITAISTGSTTTITTAINHSFVVGQEVGFSISSSWGMVQLDSQTALLANNGIPQQAYVTSVPAANQIVVNINSSSFTAFAYPTSASYALGVTPAQVYAIGDQNSGISGSAALVPLTPPIGIPGAFTVNTRQGVIIGIGNGTQIMHQTSDVIRWRAIYPDQLQTS